MSHIFGRSSKPKSPFKGSTTAKNPFAKNGVGGTKVGGTGTSMASNPFTSKDNKSAGGGVFTSNKKATGGIFDKPGASSGAGKSPNPFAKNKDKEESKEEKKEDTKEENKEETKKSATDVFGNGAKKDGDKKNVFGKKEDGKSEKKNVFGKKDDKDKAKVEPKIAKSSLNDAAKRDLDNKTIDKITHDWNNRIDYLSNKFKTSAEKLREQELEFFHLAETNIRLEEKAKEVSQEYETTQSTLTDIHSRQESLLKSLEKIDTEIEDDMFSSTNDPSNPRRAISEILTDSNQKLSDMEEAIQAITSTLNLTQENSYGSNSGSFVKSIEGEVNQQASMMAWMEQIIDELSVQLSEVRE